MSEGLEAAVDARRAHPDLPPIGPDEIDGLIEEYRGSYATIREAITSLCEARDWQPMLNDLAETLGFHGAFTVDWEYLEKTVRDNFHLIDDDHLIHVFELGPGEMPLPPAPTRPRAD
jgi:hypothetical protein